MLYDLPPFIKPLLGRVSGYFEPLQERLRFRGKSQKVFLDFVLSHYVSEGVDELSQEKLPPLLELKYHTIPDAIKELGNSEEIKGVFIGFQK